MNYTLKDLQTNEIAVSLPRQRDWNKFMKFLKENGIEDFTNSLWKEKLYRKQACVKLFGGLTAFPLEQRNTYYKDYTIITLGELTMSEMNHDKFINQALDYFGIDKKKYVVVNIKRDYICKCPKYKNDIDTLEITVQALSFFTFPKKKKLKIKVNIEDELNSKDWKPTIEQPRKINP